MHLGLLSLIEKILNQKAYVHRHDDAAFWCPACKLESHKKKLIIKLNPNNRKFGYWKCWNCKDANHMFGKSIYTLFKKINATDADLKQLESILGTSKLLVNKDIDSPFIDNKNIHIQTIHLPNEFRPLYEYRNTPEYNDALKFLVNRKITFNDLLKYNIGYAEKGDFAHRIIIPSYDNNSTLNYFIARSYYESIKPKYKKPTIENSHIIMFEIFVNWKEPIILCEGVFDAISAKRNAIPVLGNTITAGLKNKFLHEGVKDVVLALDTDAIKTSLKYIEKFLADGINVRFINMNKKDPSEIGFKNFIDLYNLSEPMDFEKMFKLKMEMK